MAFGVWPRARRVCGAGAVASIRGPFGLPCGARSPMAREANSALRASDMPRSSAPVDLRSSAPHRRRCTHTAYPPLSSLGRPLAASPSARRYLGMAQRQCHPPTSTRASQALFPTPTPTPTRTRTRIASCLLSPVSCLRVASARINSTQLDSTRLVLSPVAHRKAVSAVAAEKPSAGGKRWVCGGGSAAPMRG